jgi:hypothetical protein
MTPTDPRHLFSDLLVYLKMAVAHTDRPMAVVLAQWDSEADWQLEELPVTDPHLASLLGPRVTHAVRSSDGQPVAGHPILVLGNGGLGLLWMRDNYPGFEGVQGQLRQLSRAAAAAFPLMPLHAILWRYLDMYSGSAVEDGGERYITWPADPLYDRPVDSWTSYISLPHHASDALDLSLRMDGRRVGASAADSRYLMFTEACIRAADPLAGVDPLSEGPLEMMRSLRLWAKFAFWGSLTQNGRQSLRHLFSDDEVTTFAREPRVST